MKNKTWKKRKGAKLEQPTSAILAYEEDLGTHGIKTANNWDTQKSIATFTVTETENKRRKEREVSVTQFFVTCHEDGINEKLNCPLSFVFR